MFEEKVGEVRVFLTVDGEGRSYACDRYESAEGQEDRFCEFSFHMSTHQVGLSHAAGSRPIQSRYAAFDFARYVSSS